MQSGSCFPIPPAGPAAPPAILVADDDDLVRQFVRQLLEEQGYQVLEAWTGRQVMEQVKQRPVALVILDLVMPEMEGLETLQWLARECPAVRVLAISGAFDGVFLSCARLLGAQVTLKKPFGPEEFLAAVHTLAL